MNVNELLDTIEDLLEESTGMPLSGGKRIVDVEQIRDYLDDIRANLPVELRQAQSIVSDRAQPPFVSCSEPSDTPDISRGVCPLFCSVKIPDDSILF